MTSRGWPPSESGHDVPPRVLIVGGGVAALEGLLALRGLLDGHAAIELIAPRSDFVYRPLAVAEPFDLSEAWHLSLDDVAARHRVAFRRDYVSAVMADRHVVKMTGGVEVGYDALLVAAGARVAAWLPGALSFAGPESVSAMRQLVGALDAGRLRHVAFAAPPDTSWTLPLYELALLTAARVSERGLPGVELTIVTPEHEPLELFGGAAGAVARNVLGARRISLRTGITAERVTAGKLHLSSSETLPADRVVALPRLKGPALKGVPADDEGFIPVDEHGAVAGLDDVWAAGDATAFPIKQGGLAAQQADAAAEAIAHALGAAVEPRPFEPVLRGLLLTGLTPTYLTNRPRASGTAAGRPAAAGSAAATHPLWWPPGKIAGRHLAPYLAGDRYLSGDAVLTDRAQIGPPAAGLCSAEHQETRELIITMAESEAGWGDYRSALHWLEELEQLEGLLPREYHAKRELWRSQAQPALAGRAR